MFILIVGCGRVGSSVARAMLHEGHEVSCLDEDPESHARLEVGLDKAWEDLGGRFTVGAGLETDALVAAINTFERALKARVPEVRWSFIEPDNAD